MATAQGAYDLSCDNIVAIEGAYNPSCDGIVAGQAGAYNPPCCVIVVATAAGFEAPLPLFLPNFPFWGGTLPEYRPGVCLCSLYETCRCQQRKKVHICWLLPPLPGLGVGGRPRSLVCA